MVWFVVLVVVVLLVFLVTKNKDTDPSVVAAETPCRAERKAALEEQQRMEKAKFDEAYGKLVESYGEPVSSLQVSWRPNDIASYLYVFESAGVICLQGEVIPFKKILSYSLTDDQKTSVENTSYESETKTNTGSVLGRAVVGGVLAGGVGALAGAATAKSNTVTKPSEFSSTFKVSHKYHLFVGIDDLSNPVRELKLGSDIAKARAVAGVFDVIVSRNQNLQS